MYGDFLLINNDTKTFETIVMYLNYPLLHFAVVLVYRNLFALVFVPQSRIDE